MSTKYLRTEIGALDAQLDACRTLKFCVLAAAFCLTLPSSFGARHAFVCGRGFCRPVTPHGACAHRGSHITQFGPMSRNFTYLHRFVRWRPPNRWVHTLYIQTVYTFPSATITGRVRYSQPGTPLHNSSKTNSPSMQAHFQRWLV